MFKVVGPKQTNKTVLTHTITICVIWYLYIYIYIFIVTVKIVNQLLQTCQVNGCSLKKYTQLLKNHQFWYSMLLLLNNLYYYSFCFTII